MVRRFAEGEASNHGHPSRASLRDAPQDEAAKDWRILVSCNLISTVLVTIIMQPKAQSSAECPAARALECVGEWWSILILRDAFQGFTRFDEFKASLKIAPNILSRRLAHLTETGIFERRRYSEKPVRYEYILTAKGWDFFPVVIALFAWGNRHLTPRGESLFLAQRQTGQRLEPIVVDAKTHEIIAPDTTTLVAGSRASKEMRDRIARVRAKRSAQGRRLEAAP
jgi:DNA-binding HxlR family transcriptional regulator